jgi:hypothetical protein
MSTAQEVTTDRESPPPGRRRTRRWLIAGAVVVALFAALVTATAFLPESPDRMPLSATNPRPNGVRALAQVLERNGVEVVQETTLAEAVAAAPALTTLVVVLTQDLSEAAIAELNQVRADLVVVHAGGYGVTSIDALTEGRVTTDYWWSPTDLPPRADCSDPDAEAAGTLTASDAALYPLDYGVVACFANPDEVALYASLYTREHRVTVIAGDDWLRNDTILEEGNAALALRVFGRRAKLVWYLPGGDAVATGTEAGGPFDLFTLLPPWSRAVLAVLLVAGASAALWRGRRFGALVPEPMPVEIPASEVAGGLARLYRQAGSRGHAAAGLRAATLHRLARRLGLPASAPAELVVERLGQHTGYSPEYLHGLFYGPPPPTDAALVELATALTDLERKPTRE